MARQRQAFHSLMVQHLKVAKGMGLSEQPNSTGLNHQCFPCCIQRPAPSRDAHKKKHNCSTVQKGGRRKNAELLRTAYSNGCRVSGSLASCQTTCLARESRRIVATLILFISPATEPKANSFLATFRIY